MMFGKFSDRDSRDEDVGGGGMVELLRRWTRGPIRVAVRFVPLALAFAIFIEKLHIPQHLLLLANGTKRWPCLVTD